LSSRAKPSGGVIDERNDKRRGRRQTFNKYTEREREREREKEIRTATTVIQPTDSIKMNSKLTVYIHVEGLALVLVFLSISRKYSV